MSSFLKLEVYDLFVLLIHIILSVPFTISIVPMPDLWIGDEVKGNCSNEAKFFLKVQKNKNAPSEWIFLAYELLPACFHVKRILKSFP